MAEITPEQRKELEEKLKKMSPEELREFQKKQCIFCQLAAGKMEAKKVYEDDKCFAVLDINPANAGHILLLPKEHYSIMPQVPEEEIGHLFVVSKHLSQVLLKSLQAQGTTIFVANGLAAGQRAQHFMIHIIPRFENDGVKELDIPQKEINEADLNRLRGALINKINQVMGIKKEVVLEKKEQKGQKQDKEKTEEKKTEAGEEAKEEEKKVVKGKKEPAKEKKKKEPKKKNGKKEEASLDDIAELFK